MLRLFWTPILFILFVVALQAQPGKWQKILGLQLLESNQYAEAITTLKIYHQNHPTNDDVLLAIAICSYHLKDIVATELYLNLIKQHGKVRDKKLILYNARLNYAKGEYKEAINLYKVYLKKEKQALDIVKQELIQCANGLKITPKYIDHQYSEESLPINSAFNDYGLILSPTQKNRYYFTSNRNGNNDTFLIDSTNAIISLETQINTQKNETLAGFSTDGNTIYFFREDTLQHLSILSVEKNVVFPDFHINHPFWYNDSTLLFSSNQLGGYGGYDLFFSILKNGRWSIPNNLGSIINSAFDEQYPFLADDGQTLFFSTNQPQLSIGGMDIVCSQFKSNQKNWETPIPLTAINTYADETHFFLTPSNDIFYTTNHWSGMGERDIFKTRLSSVFVFPPQPLLFNDLIERENLSEVPFDGLIYRIFITKKSTLEERITQNFSDVFVQQDTLGYSYYIGKYQSFFSALELLMEIKKTNWDDAKIVAFKDNIILKEEELEQLVVKYPDIKNYIDYQKQ